MVEFGKKIYPPKKSGNVEKTSTSIKGAHWSIELVGEDYIYEYMSGGHGGGIKRAIIPKEDFEAVHAGSLSEYELALKHNLS